MRIIRVSLIGKPSLFGILLLALVAWDATLLNAGSVEEKLRNGAYNGDLTLIKSLLDKGANVNAASDNGWTALMVAASSDRVEIARFLLDKGAEVNAKSIGGYTPLMCAASNGTLEMVQLLVDRGADVTGASDNGETALMSGSERGVAEIVALLLDKGARIDSRTEDHGTALIKAAGYGNFEVVRQLLDKGADVNARTLGGRTALMQAAALDHQLRPVWYYVVWDELMGFAEFVRRRSFFGPSKKRPYAEQDLRVLRLLLQRGAEVNARDRDGWTALKRAQNRGSTEAVEILKAYGAKE